MSIKLEKVVEKFYQNLEEGKITGRKCCACGAVEFPPCVRLQRVRLLGYGMGGDRR